jgi:dihydrolipoamide dehydrogenase
MNEYEVVVIGGGTAGVAAAQAAAGQGARAGLVEAGRPGGHSLFKRQLPLQVLRQQMESCEDKIPLGALDQAVKEKAEQTSREILEDLQNAGVEWIPGEGSLAGGHQVLVHHDEQPSTLKAGKVIIASGSRVKPVAMIPFDDQMILPLDGLLNWNETPASVLIVGGDTSALEAAQWFNLLGTKVFLVDENHRLIHQRDPDLITALEAGFKKQKIKVLLGKKVISIFKGNDQIDITLDGGVKFSTERMLVSGERVGNTEKLGLDALNIEKGRNQEIWVNETMETSLQGVFAAGSVTGRSRSREISEEEGRVAGINAAGGRQTLKPDQIPFCLHTHPEIASIGCLSGDAHFKGFRAVEGRYDAGSNDVSSNTEEGFCKVVADRDSKRIIGAQFLGEQASVSMRHLQSTLRGGASLQDMVQSGDENPAFFKPVIKAAQACLRALSARR